MLKIFEDMFIHFDRMYKHYWQNVRTCQTDGQTAHDA